MDLDRRHFLVAAGAVSLPAVLAGCGFAPSSSSDSQPSGSDTITFTTWGTDSELAGFRSAISSFESANPGSTVTLNAVPYDQMFTNIDAQLQAGNPPDVFRVPYYTFGSYAGRGQLLDLGPHLSDGFSDRFTPQAWAAVQNGGKAYGVPHHTDTSVILYNKALLESAGITSVPTSLDQAWTWDEFAQLLQTMRDKLPGSRYPLAVNWQGNGVTRWLSWLFESDGRFLAEDLKTPAIDSAQGKEALDFTKSFFEKKFVPQNNSVKSTKLAADLWYGQTTAMTFGGAFLIPDSEKTLEFEWGATFSPRNKRSAGDFGGNALVATKAARNPALVAKFFDHMTNADQMRAFCESASLLPTRADLIEKGIDFKVRPELSPVFVGQASSVKAQDSGQVASPSMSKIITVLKDNLESAFVGGQDTAAALSSMSSGIGAATAS